MASRMPRATIEELEELVAQLTKHNVEQREAAMVRLAEHERNGRVPLEALLEFADAEHAPLSMYAISALGRNGDAEAVRKLGELLERHRETNVLLLETVVDALGETRSAAAAPMLLGLLGIRSGWSGKLFGRRARREEDDAAEQQQRERLVLPVVRALEKIADPKAAEQLEPYLSHEDHLVRWHAVQTLAAAKVNRFNVRLQEMSEHDASEVVREAAAIALEGLAPLPPNLN